MEGQTADTYTSALVYTLNVMEVTCALRNQEHSGKSIWLRMKRTVIYFWCFYWVTFWPVKSENKLLMCEVKGSNWSCGVHTLLLFTLRFCRGVAGLASGVRECQGCRCWEMFLLSLIPCFTLWNWFKICLEEGRIHFWNQFLPGTPLQQSGPTFLCLLLF